MLLLMTTTPYTYVDDPAALVEFCIKIHEAPWIALDTEFVREKTFYPQLCLIQIATDQAVACIDPLTLPDLGPLLDILYNPSIVKVMHAARQDMEMFYHLRGELPRPIFDTQLAAPLLGLKEQMGYAGLVESMLGVLLNKAHTRADWSHRPLSRAELEYAADDVRYLAALYPRLRANLAVKGRLLWLENDFAELSEPSLYANPPADAWLRVKGLQRLRSHQLSVAQDLAKWREATAQQQDRPRSWILRDENLLDLARLQPKNKTELAQLRGLHEQSAARHGESILQVIADAQNHPPIPLPATHQTVQLTETQEAVVDVLLAVIRKLSAEHSIHPSVIASRKQLEQLVQGDTSSAVLHGWRKNMVGETLLAVLAGTVRLRVQDGSLLLLTDI